MATDNHKTKDRSPNFPFIDLEAALVRAQEFYAAEKRGAAPMGAVAKHWRYSAASSGLLQTAAAMKSYGLMADEGSGQSRMLRLTELALRILLDPRPNSRERAGFLRQAALTPTVAADIYARWPEGLPSVPTLLHHLVLERGFSEQRAKIVCKIIYSNEELTAKYAVDVESFGSKIENEGFADKEAAGATTMSVPSTQLPSIRPATVATVVSPPPANPNAERLTFPGAEIVINFDGPPSYAVFEFIESYMQLRKKLFAKPKEEAKKLAEPDDSDT